MKSSMTGRWTGKTDGSEKPAHIWSITEKDDTLVIQTSWKDTPEKVVTFTGRMNSNREGFIIPTGGGDFQAKFVDDNQFVVQAWHGGKDVVFSRAG